jgi:hypothetical protein
MEAHAGKGGDNMKRVGGVAGKYAKLRDDGANAVLLAPEVAGAFRDSKSVNDALRIRIKIAEPRKTGAELPARKQHLRETLSAAH